MTTAATSLLGLALPVTGELSGTWGDTVNNSITALLDSAVAGTTTLSADADVTLTTTTLAANQAREAIILWTAAGTVTRYITAPAQSKIYAVLNKSSTQSIVLRGVGPTTGVTILAGKQAMVAWDGTDYVEISSGYVDGPATSTDNAVARFDGTDGKLLQNSVVIIADTTGNMTGVGTLSSGAITSSSLTATRVLFAGIAGLIQDDADLTFNGTILTSTGFAGPLNGTVGATTANTGNFTTLGATGNVTLGDASTDTVQVNGYMGVGGAASNTTAIKVMYAPTGLNQFGIDNVTPLGGATNSFGYRSSFTTATSVAITTLRHLSVDSATLGSGSTITSQTGVHVGDLTTGTNNYGITSLVSSGTNKFNIYASGTAANYFAGNVGIGGVASLYPLEITGTNANTLVLRNTTEAVATDVLGIRFATGTSGAALSSANILAGIEVDITQATPSILQAALTFSTNAGDSYTERMRIDSAGNVGVGTTSPTSTLSVTGTANVTGNVTLGDATTDTVTVNGYVGVGGAPSSAQAIRVTSSALGGTDQTGIISLPTINSGSTITGNGVGSRVSTAAAAFTVANLHAFYAYDAIKGAGSTITNQHGLYVSDQTQGTNNYGISSLVSSGTNKFNIYASGTAQNYFAGNVGIGTNAPSTPLHVAATLSAGAIASVAFFGQNSGANPTIGQGSRITLSATSNTDRAVAIEGVHESGTNAHYMAFLTSANGASPTEKMRIISAGNVGIGTSSPTSTLSVTGTANVTGNVTLGDASTDTVTVNGYMGVGGAATNNIGLQVSSTALSGAGPIGFASLPVGPATATTSIRAVHGRADTAAASFTVADVMQFQAANSTKGAGSTITNQHGLYIADQTQGTSNYGITSLVSSGTNKWNIYASGTAANYFAGNVGLGVTPSAWGGTYKGLDIAAYGGFAAGASAVAITGNSYWNGTVQIYKATAAATRYEQSAGSHQWYNAPSGTAGATATFTQAMTLDASGRLLVGTTVIDPVGSRVDGTVIGSGASSFGIRTRATAGYSYIGINSTSGTSLGFYTDNGTTFVASGNISSNGATTLYNATSDYRLKTVLGVVTGQGARIDALEPIEYEWKADGSRARGFLAHKFQAIYANSVTETKDAVDADNNPVYQTMQASSAEVIADLVAELQSLRARVASLESK